MRFSINTMENLAGTGYGIILSTGKTVTTAIRAATPRPQKKMPGDGSPGSFVRLLLGQLFLTIGQTLFSSGIKASSAGMVAISL
jgi:hypothetical protein